MSQRKLSPTHPGEILKEMLEEANLSGHALALRLRIPPNRITEILACRRSISADTALRLGQFFGTSAHMWLNLQSTFELQTAEEQLGGLLKRDIVPLARSVASRLRQE